MGKVTQYGFLWGPMEVSRLADIGTHRVIRVEAGKHHIEIYVSPTGRSIRVFDDKNRELKAGE